MPLASVTEHENLKKTRKSLYFSVAFTFAIANAELLSDQVSIFGLSIAVVQSDLISFGQLVTVFLLAIFSLHSLVAIVEAMSVLLKRINERWNTRSMAVITRIDQQLYGDPSFDYDNPYEHLDEWEYQHITESEKRDKIENFVATLVDIVTGLRNFILEYLLVLVASIFALRNPKIIGTLVQSWQAF